VSGFAAVMQVLIDGAAIGGVYALMASGLALTFGVMRVANFAQGDFVMLGMYGAFLAWRTFGWDPYLAVIPLALLVFGFGAASEYGLLERLPVGQHNPQLLLTLGLSLVLQNGVLAVMGATPYGVSTSYGNSYFGMGSDLLLNKAQLLAGVASALAMTALYLFLGRTAVGRGLRATADDPSAASWSGINVRNMRALAFGIGAGLAAIAGCIVATFTTMTPTTGQDFLFVMFVAVVLGGVGSIPGAALGAMLVGIVQALATLVLPLQLDNGVIYTLLILVLLFRPNGIFGLKARV
jgi:branched-chain amino acid transport system permease protein